jgi:hypothetical protein
MQTPGKIENRFHGLIFFISIYYQGKWIQRLMQSKEIDKHLLLKPMNPNKKN